LFFALSAGFLVIAAAASFLSWYMVTPRLLQWYPGAPAILLVLLALLLVLLGVALGILAIMLLTGWPRSARASWLARQILAMVEVRVFWLGGFLAIDKDRLAHAFVRINNILVRLDPRGAAPDHVILLLPRCLGKEQLEQARDLARSSGVEVAIVGGGEQARQRIQEKRPRLVIGVACERDLLSGIRDVRGQISVLGIPNRRPEGPCRNTQIDLEELKSALDSCVRPAFVYASSVTDPIEVTR
jgi:hypothetical protein